MTGEFYVATPLAVARGNLLLLQCQETLKYNHLLADYGVQELLKYLFSMDVMKELSEFAEGKLMDDLVKGRSGKYRIMANTFPY